MAKRLTSGDKWNDPWFRKLRPEFKLMFVYLCECCDMAGVWQADWDLAEFAIGTSVEQGAFLAAMAGRVAPLHGDASKLHVTRFVEFQQPQGLNPKQRFHQGIIRLLEKYRLPVPAWDPDRVSDGSLTHKVGVSNPPIHSHPILSVSCPDWGGVEGADRHQRSSLDAYWEHADILRVRRDPATIIEWADDLKDIAKVRCLNEALVCWRWAVETQRKADKVVEFSRHCANQFTQWRSVRDSIYRPKRDGTGQKESA